MSSQIQRSLPGSRVCSLVLMLAVIAGVVAYGQTALVIQRGESLDATYKSVLNEVKKEGFDIESSSAEAGIKTELVISGHYHQIGSRVDIQFVKNEETKTSIKVSVLEQTRYEALKTEPWSDPKLNADQSAALASRLKEGLGWKD